MGKVLSLTGEEPPQVEKKAAPRRAVCAEEPESTFLLQRKDEQGRTWYFFDCRISGLHRRVFGPFTTKQGVYALADLVLNEALEALCECQNRCTDYGNVHAQQFTELPAYARRGRRS